MGCGQKQLMIGNVKFRELFGCCWCRDEGNTNKTLFSGPGRVDGPICVCVRVCVCVIGLRDSPLHENQQPSITEKTVKEWNFYPFVQCLFSEKNKVLFRRKPH